MNDTNRALFEVYVTYFQSQSFADATAKVKQQPPAQPVTFPLPVPQAIQIEERNGTPCTGSYFDRERPSIRRC